jgi:hypothetical protein
MVRIPLIVLIAQNMRKHWHQSERRAHDGTVLPKVGVPHSLNRCRYSPGKLMHNLGNALASDDAVEDDPRHPMRLNWCGIINVNEFIWFQLTKV